LPNPLVTQPQLLTDNGRPKRTAIFDHYREPLATLYDDHDEINCLQAGNL